MALMTVHHYASLHFTQYTSAQYCTSHCAPLNSTAPHIGHPGTHYTSHCTPLRNNLALIASPCTALHFTFYTSFAQHCTSHCTALNNTTLCTVRPYTALHFTLYIHDKHCT